MKKVYAIALVGFIAAMVLLSWFNLAAPATQAANISAANSSNQLPDQQPLAPAISESHRALGLVFDGLSGDSACIHSYAILGGNSSNGHARCTHGPDAAPANFNVSKTVAPVTSKKGFAPTATSGITCDGDGMSGNRVQVIYAHASDVTDQYATYLASFQQWAAGMDNDYNTSAGQTGGTRHIRFVTDSSCNLVIPDVTLSTTGDDTFGNTINELQAQGYNLTNRKYVVFEDAHIYCGISNIIYDDQPGAANSNNSGPDYGRVDAGCWSDVVPAHELMHELGGVQLSAPNSDGSWHCNDGYDNMCDHSGHAVNIVCGDTSMDSYFDCNHDDYYTTSAAAGSYLATHWNAANSMFLIAPLSVRDDSIVTGTVTKGVFTASKSFKRNTTVVAKIHVMNQYNANQSGVSVSVAFKTPKGTTQCTVAATTDTTGTVQVSCSIPSSGTTGTWDVHVNSLTMSGYAANYSSSVMDYTFSVQ